MKFNILDHAKTLIYSLCAVVVAAIIVVCIFGFNLGTELKGYIELKINHGQFYFEEEQIDKFVEDTKILLKENDAKIVAINFEGSGFTEKVIFTIERKDGTRNENIEFAEKLENAVKTYYNNDLMVVESSLVEGVMTDTDVVKLVYTVLLALIIVMVYLLFRLKLLNTVCILMTSLATIILMASFTALVRVKLNLSMFGVVIAMTMLSTLVSTMRLGDIKNNKIVSKKQMGVIEFNFSNAIMLCISFVAFALLVIFGTNLVRNYAMLVLLGLLSVWLADNLVLVPTCYYFNNFTVSKIKPVVVTDIDEEGEEKEEKTEKEPIEIEPEETEKETDEKVATDGIDVSMVNPDDNLIEKMNKIILPKWSFPVTIAILVFILVLVYFIIVNAID